MYGSLHPLSAARHAFLRLRPAADYRFAAGEILLPLSAAEVAQAAAVLPLAVIEAEGAHQLAALVGVEQGRSLMVGSGGEWRGTYVPFLLRSYPFALASPGPDQPTVICVDESSALLSDREGEPLFVDGQPTPVLASRIEQLRAHALALQRVGLACRQLADLGVLVAWPVRVMVGSEARVLQGLLQVDEGALGALSDEDFLSLRRTGALAVAYAQLLARAHLASIGRLASRPDPSRPSAPGPIHQPGLVGDELFRFD